MTPNEQVPDFQALFGRAPQSLSSAPGRVNLIGEHTDYNGGFVLPLALSLRTHVELAPREDRVVRAISTNLPQEGCQSFVLGQASRSGNWLDYLKGVTVALENVGTSLAGFDARITSDLPLGSGLSSSAALEIALLRAIRELFHLELNDVELARLGQRAENDFVGAPVGIMDQMAASLGDEQHALFIDTLTLEYKRLPLPEAAELLVIDSGVAHRHATGEYRLRRNECEQAARLLGVKTLRDWQDLGNIGVLPPPLDRRVRHVLTENSRVLEAMRALQTGDLPELGALFYESHRSMRDDYQVSVPEIDVLVDLAQKEGAVYGARLTGGGFGGSIVALTQRGTAAAVAERILRAYHRTTHRKARVLVPRDL